MIFYDPTENRDNTLLDRGVLQAGRELPGLEKMTGADLLISRGKLDLQSVTSDMPPPMQFSFKKACREGALVQRKSGLDLLSSLSKLNKILYRMLQWTDEPWLVSTGVVDRNGEWFVLNGNQTKWRYEPVMAKLGAWQRRGGYWMALPDDGSMSSFVKQLETKWVRGKKEKRIESRTPMQALIPAGWEDKLCVIPGIGPTTAKAISRWLPPSCRNVSSALCYLSNEGNYRRSNHPKGVGPATFQMVKAWLEIEPGRGLVETDMTPVVEVKEGLCSHQCPVCGRGYSVYAVKKFGSTCPECNCFLEKVSKESKK
jgi:hypothetical protein